MTNSRKHLRKFVLAMGLACLCTAHVGAAEQTEEKLNPGVVIEKVISTRDQTKSYALYLPTAYTTTRRFPVLYCFDPMARGAIPVARFKEAAEKYGYIVVGSNNSRNGPNQPLTEIVRDLWEDTHARFSLDEQRAYLAGFSGGARVAISLGFRLQGRIAGVIACGAGFPTEIPASTPRPFVLFTVAGIDDFNNPELQSLFRKLENSTPPIRLSVFDGGHTWPPVQLATEAVQWLELQAMKSGMRERNQALIDEIFEHVSAQALAAQTSGDRYRAYRGYVAMAQDFAGLHDIAEVDKKARELGAAKDVIDAAKQERKMEDEQDRRIERIHSLIGAHEVAQENFEPLMALRDELKTQREAAKATEPSVKRTIARRVIESLFIEFIELGNTAVARKQYERAANAYFVCTEIQPENARTFYYLARAHALAGAKSKALAALKTAAEKGFTGVQELTSQEFADLQTEKRFQEILDVVKKNQNSRQ